MKFEPKRFPIIHDAPVWMTMQERVVLYGLVAGLQPRTVLEIGTFQGGSTMIMCAALDDLGEGRIVCVDPDPRVDPQHWASIEHRATMVAAPSPEAVAEAARRAGAPFDVALIDGDHSFDGVVRDIEATLPTLADDAHLIFHDVHYFEVGDAIDRCLERHGDVLCDAGLVSAGVTPHEEESPGREVFWGGLRLLRYRRAGIRPVPEPVAEPELVSPPTSEPLAPVAQRALRRLRRAGRVLLTGRP
ncbi:MAG: class I SAM-dependent methyltransferase [Acidimicrobiales bacterium]